jgi:hypothetical protein
MERLLLKPFILLILLTSCEEIKKEVNKNTTSETLKGKLNKKEFEAFLANFKPAKFPMKYSQYDPYPSKFPILNHELFPFYLPESQGPITPYGYVKLNDSKIALIFFYHSEDYLVGIRTFTNDGIKIDEMWGQKPVNPKSYIFPFYREGLTPQKKITVSNQVTQNINKWMKQIGEKLELSVPVTTYTARHTFSTVLKRSGASIEFISESLGHPDLKVTQNYLDSFEDDKRKEMSLLLLG